MHNILNEEQVSIIRKHVIANGAYYYDIEVELTDHICNMLEQLMHKYENLSFDEALNKALKVFEPEGLSNLIKKRVEYNKNISPESLLFEVIRKAFKLPHLLLTVAVISIYYLIYQTNQNDLTSLRSILMAISLSIIISSYILGFLVRKPLKNQIKRISTLNNYSISSRLGAVGFLGIINMYVFKHESYTALQYSLYAGLQCLTILYVIGIVYNNHLHLKKAKKQFPNAFS